MKNLFCIFQLLQSLCGGMFGYNQILHSNNFSVAKYIYVDVDCISTKNNKSIVDHLKYNSSNHKTLGSVLENEAPIGKNGIFFEFASYGVLGSSIIGYKNSDKSGINYWSVYNFGNQNSLNVDNQEKWNDKKNYANYGIDSIQLKNDYFGVKEI